MHMHPDGFLSLWNVEPLQQAEATDKLFYRVIGGYKFQFRKCDYRLRSALMIDIAKIGKSLIPIMQEVFAFIPDPNAANDTVATELADAQLALKIMPLLIDALAIEGLQDVVDRLCATAYCDVGSGTFEPLSSDVTGEKVFGDDVTLQIPVAVTAALVNLDPSAKRMLAA